jgi:hypothetical protein
MVRAAAHKRTWRSIAARNLRTRTSSASVEHAVLEIVSELFG